jgi:hypothetical protein
VRRITAPFFALSAIVLLSAPAGAQPRESGAGHGGPAGERAWRRAAASARAMAARRSASEGRGDPAIQETARIERVSVAPRLEDYLGGSPPPGSRAVGQFVQREPGDGVPASQRTDAYLSYDDDHLYVVFVCHDSEPDKIRARRTRREGFGGDDVVGVVLDTFHDRRRSYVFLVNPLGIQMDGVATEGQNDDYTFDTLWRSEGRVTSFGYVVWISLPFKSLRFPATGTQTWGMALGRIIPRNNETSFWPYITRRIAGFGQQFATLEGLERISPGRNIQFIPYAAFAGARFLETEGPSFETDADGRAGLDAKVVVKDAFTIDAALNPDFSQIESDEPQVTINQRFEVFFPERRPFFIENASYFDLPIQLFFSRRIADPQFGGRLTGKSGGWAIGALTSDDRAPGRRVGASSPVFGDRTGTAVIRAQRDFGEQSGIGFLGTSRDFADSFSRVVSVDGRVKLHTNWVVNGQIALSRTAALDGVAATGSALQAAVTRSGRTFEYAARYRDIDPGFRAPLGFVQRVDMRELEQNVDYNWRPARGPVVRFGPDLVARAIWNHDGRLEDWLVSPDFNVEMKGQTFAGVDYRESFERFEGLEFRKRSVEPSVTTSWLRWLSISGSYTWGSEINYFPAAGLEPFLGRARQASLGVTLRPLPPLRLDATYLFSGLAVRSERPIVGEAPGSRIFSNHILRSRVNYQFTRALSMRTIVDYGAVLPNAALVDLTQDKRFTADVLFTYLLNPGTALYVGYTDRYENLRIDPLEGGLTRVSSPFQSVGRQVFVKASYLLRF